MAKVKLITEDGTVLRSRRVGTDSEGGEVRIEYFEMSVPLVGSYLDYYTFNKEFYTEKERTPYKVLTVVQELQESWNGTFEERFTVSLKEES